MQWSTIDDAKALLDQALKGKLCVQTWIGYAGVLFAGFGEETISPVQPGNRHPLPPYEIETGFADWSVLGDDEVIASSKDDVEEAEMAASKLVGCRVVQWSFVAPSVAFEIFFDSGLKLSLAPYDGYEGSHESAWCLRTPEYGSVMNWDGTMESGAQRETPESN
jgi:hypothetical protein